jgi:membrane carboxypeptidase/penicillin-binding protein
MTGAAAALPVWVDVMIAATVGHTPQDFPVPMGVVNRRVCTETGLLANPGCPSTDVELFREGDEPSGYCNVHTGEPRQQPGAEDFRGRDTEAPPEERLRL